MAISAADAVKAIAVIEKQLSALRAFAGLPAEAAAVKSKPAAAEKPPTKRVLSPSIIQMNEERAAVFEELKAAWAEANPEFASLDDKALAAAVKNGEVDARPRFSDALQEHGRRARADDPEKQAKYEAYRAKVEATRAEKSGPSSVASSAEGSAEAPVADVKKRKPQSAETKAAAALKRAATKAANAAKSAPAAANPFDEPALPPAAQNTEIVSASADDEEAFAEWEHKGVKYWKNGLQFVYKRNSDNSFGNYAGHYDVPKKNLDALYPEPPA